MFLRVPWRSLPWDAVHSCFPNAVVQLEGHYSFLGLGIPSRHYKEKAWNWFFWFSWVFFFLGTRKYSWEMPALPWNWNRINPTLSVPGMCSFARKVQLLKATKLKAHLSSFTHPIFFPFCSFSMFQPVLRFLLVCVIIFKESWIWHFLCWGQIGVVLSFICFV